MSHHASAHHRQILHAFLFQIIEMCVSFVGHRWLQLLEQSAGRPSAASGRRMLAVRRQEEESAVARRQGQRWRHPCMSRLGHEQQQMQQHLLIAAAAAASSRVLSSSSPPPRACTCQPCQMCSADCFRIPSPRAVLLLPYLTALLQRTPSPLRVCVTGERMHTQLVRIHGDSMRCNCCHERCRNLLSRA